MFVPVACLKCGKPFQVSEADAGNEVPCPWCTAATPALPIAGVSATAPVAPAPGPPDSVTPAPEPLSLDDATENDSGGLTSPGSPTPSPGRPKPTPDPAARRSFRTPIIALGLSVLVFVATVAGLMVWRGYGSGQVPDSAWTTFSPPDGSFSASLPGSPAAESIDPHPSIAEIGGGQRFVTRGWYSKTTAWVGWCDLNAGWAKKVVDGTDRTGAMAEGVLSAELERQKAWLAGTVTKEVVFRQDAYLGREAHLDTPRGKAVVRLLVAPDGPHPRLYFMGVESKAAGPDDPVAGRLFKSWRLAKGERGP
jgi:hypothetical protein